MNDDLPYLMLTGVLKGVAFGVGLLLVCVLGLNHPLATALGLALACWAAWAWRSAASRG